MNNLLLVFSDLEHSFFSIVRRNSVKNPAITPMRRLTPNSRYILYRWFGHSFLCSCVSVLLSPFFSLSLVGMERELPSAFLLPGSVSLSGISGSFFFFLTDEGRNWRSNLRSLDSYVRTNSNDWWIGSWVKKLRYFLGWKNDKETDIAEDGKDPIACLFLGPPPPWWVLYSSQHEIGRYVT